MRVGILGGTFNPVHLGHLRAAEEVRELLGLGEVLFIPAGVPPLKNADLVDVTSRVEMVRLATAGNAAFKVLDIEATRPGPSYTIDTIGTLGELYPEDDLVFIVGADAFLDLPKWKDAGKIVCAADFAIVCRPGVPALDLLDSPHLSIEPESLGRLDRGEGTVAEGALVSGKGEPRKAFVVRTTALDISATDIRKRLGRGQSVAYLLPETVKSFIITNALYSGDTS
ncbi:MAG: nicotinate-nucleotide adenylyltransferase [Thermodesulfovibrionales bacterium]|nr:nicotinate-nucleotide adenylyltransferase [Thermodesulfovibrionales bacterium]